MNAKSSFIQDGICRWSQWGGRDWVVVAHPHKIGHLVPYLEIQWRSPPAYHPGFITTMVINPNKPSLNKNSIVCTNATDIHVSGSSNRKNNTAPWLTVICNRLSVQKSRQHGFKLSECICSMLSSHFVSIR